MLRPSDGKVRRKMTELPVFSNLGRSLPFRTPSSIVTLGFRGGRNLAETANCLAVALPTDVASNFGYSTGHTSC